MAPFRLLPHLALLAVMFTQATLAHSQEFTKIVGSYHCARLSNGSQFLVDKKDTGFDLVSTAEVKNRFNRQRRLLVQRSKLISEVIADFKRARIAKSRLIQTLNGTLRKFFPEDTPILKTLPPEEVESRALEIRDQIQAEIAKLDTVRGLIADCESGINPRKGGGTVISPSVEPVVAVTRNSIVGGALMTTLPQRFQSNSKPGGYNACIKAVYPDGFVSKVYLGFDNDANCSPGIFGELSPAQCASLVPEGRVGYLVQMSTYNFVSLPDATTEQLVERMRLELIPRLPAVAVLAFLAPIARERAIKFCESF